jgi:hypothetical protein
VPNNGGRAATQDDESRAAAQEGPGPAYGGHAHAAAPRLRRTGGPGVRARGRGPSTQRESGAGGPETGRGTSERGGKIIFLFLFFERIILICGNREKK